jgi:hypothetical protein
MQLFTALKSWTGTVLTVFNSWIELHVPKEADELRDRLYGMLPHVKITDLLLEVDRWTGLTRCFTHLKTGEPAKDSTLLLTAILADATNLGLAKMAESCPGTSPSKLSWLVAWHIRDETYSKAPWPESSTIVTVCPSLHIGARELLLLPTANATAREGGAKRQAK